MKNLNQIFEALGSTAEFLFEPVTSVYQRGCSGDTPLHVVCSWGDADAVDTLIQAGADVNALGEQQKTPLFSAVIGKSSEAAQHLLDAGADSTAEDQDGISALQFAQLLTEQALQKDSELISLLTAAIATQKAQGR